MKNVNRKHVSRITLLVLSLLTLAISNPSLFHSVRADPTSGDAPLVATVDVSTLPAAQNSTGSVEIPVGPVPFVAAGNSSAPQSDVSVASSSSVVMVSGFEGLNQNQGGAYPPDVIAAAGPNHIVEMVNLAGGIWNKQGTLIRTFGLSSFFSTGTDFISDPKILYDATSARWFASILAVDNVNAITRGNVKIAVSTTNDPTGTWKIYTLDDANRLPDQPLIGLNDDKFVASVNDFGSIFGPFLGAHYWILNKSQMVAGAATISFASFGPNSSLGSVHPVQALSSSTTMYMVSAWFSGSTVWFFSITGVPPGIVSVNTVTFAVAPIPPPPNAVQKGTTALVRTDDARVQSAAWFQGKLWFDLNDGCIPTGDTVQRSCIRLVQIDTSSSTILQNFDFGTNGIYYFYPALRVDSTGGVAVVFGFSSTNDYPSIAISGQAANDPKKSMAAPVTIKTGLSPNTSGRYGDYFGAGVDPSDPTLVWVAGEYQPSIWGTFLASMRVLSYTVSANPNSLSLTADSSATSTITLASLGGFAGTVSLSASVTPPGAFATLSPSSVTLTAGGTSTSTLTVSSSVAGAYTVTITGTSGSISHSANVTVTVNNFSLTASPSSITIASGRSGSLTVQAGSVNGYTGSVALSIWSGLPTCVSSGFTKPTLTLSAGGTDSSVLLLNVGSGCAASTGNVWVAGTDLSGVRRFAYFTLSISEFAISVTPQPVGILKSSCGDVTVTVFSLNGHSGLITLLGSGFPPEISATFLTNPVSLPSGGSATSTLHLCAANTTNVGTFATTISGSDGVISRTTTFQILLNDYSFGASPNPTVLRQGATTSTTITASKYFGASATLSLSATGIPACVASSFSPASLTLPDGGQSLLSTTASSTCTLGDYTVTVTADGPGTSFDKQVTFILRIAAAGGGGGGGGGSVAAGTAVTLIDGSKVPVQNIKVGDKLMAYDPTTGQIIPTTVVDAYSVTVTNMVKIRLLDGTTIRTDNNPSQEFWVMKPDGTTSVMGIPSIEVGDYLFRVSTRSWVQVTEKQLITGGGTFTMYDIVTTGQYHYVVNGYLDLVKKIV